MFFELCEKFDFFQFYINDVLKKYFDDFCIAYIDDILIYNKSIKKHKIHVRKMLKTLRFVELQLNIEKCEFFVIEIIYLKLIIFNKNIRMNFQKVLIIKE